MAVNSGARLWSVYKELYHTVQAAVLRKVPDAIHDLEVALRKQKPDFISLLQNPAKNTVHRDAVKKADTQGITIAGQQGSQLLGRAFIEEVLIISNLFNLNEYAAVELLLAGESQLPYFPGLTRGLVAVLLYYDGRASIVNALRTLIQARSGRTWTLGLSGELTSIVMKFTDQVMSEGMVTKILDLIRGMDIVTELDRLQKDRALGHAKHRKQVTDLCVEVRLSLAECLFCWACQNPLPKAATLQLISHLKADPGLTAEGTTDPVTMALLMALLYSLDVRILDQEDAEDVIQKLPVIQDDLYVAEVHRDIMAGHKWENQGLGAVIRFAWALTLRALSQYPSIQGINEFCEEDEIVVDSAVDDDVFLFLRQSIVETSVFHKEEFYVRQIHNMIVDLIVHMPLKVKELRNRGDETARLMMSYAQEGLEPPSNLRRHFEHLMKLIAAVYGKDPLGLELSLEYWCPLEPAPSNTMGASYTTYNYRPHQRQISLYKFLRHSGDLLPPSLYIPYINMLTGLANSPQSAHHAFNLLKMNCGQNSTIAWDHFFTSMNQYYTSLRQEVAPPSDMAHVYRHHARGITSQEVEGIIVVLRLTRTIAENDEAARLLLVDNQHWMLVVVLLGLVSCSLPPRLKAELLHTLAALAKTPEIAESLWQSLEVSQMVPTVVTSGLRQNGGIPIELDEVEARNEEYPMTLAFLSLLNALTDVPVPAALGAGYRIPGFDPYLDFLKDDVLLKFNTRAYKDAAQRWEVGAAVLEILQKLLSGHRVALEDFQDQHVSVIGGGSAVANKPPGHTLLIHMLNSSPLLKTVLYIIDEGTKQLDTCMPIPGQRHLEAATLSCLKMVEGVLAQQDTLLMALRESGASVMVDTMDRLLLGINPRSSRPDHLVNIARYVTYNVDLPEHALYAVKILWGVCQSSLAQPELVGLFTSTERGGVDLLHGFVECLEAEDPEDSETADLTDMDTSSAQIRNGTRQTIMQLLFATVDQPAPNLAHFLLGFELRKPVYKTELQDPGVLDSPRTCLHSVLTLLDRETGTQTEPACLRDMPRSASLAYHIIYVLCANKDTSGPTMRYLRTAHDFLYRHLHHLPFQLQSGVKSNSAEAMLGPQSWLLRTAAIELRLTSINRQRSHTQRLLNLLLNDNPSSQTKVLRGDGTYEPDYSQYDTEMSTFSVSQSQLAHAVTGGQSRRKILNILDSIDLHQNLPEPLQYKFFEAGTIEQVIQACEARSELGVSVCNVKMLHQRLLYELNKCNVASTFGQGDRIMEEITLVCEAVIKRNQLQVSKAAKRAALEAWRQVVEVILTACPEDLLSAEMRQNVIFELLHELLHKVSDEEVLSELSAPVSGVILTLMSNLLHSFLATTPDTDQANTLSQYVTLLDSSSGAHSAAFEQPTGSRTLFSSSLQVVLKGLIEYLLRSSSGAQRVRANLYGALLYYLQIAQKPKVTGVFDPALSKEKGVGAMIALGETEYDRLTADNLSTISSYGSNLMDVVCRDACDGHDVGRMLALSVLDSILSFDLQKQWLSFMTSKGYIQHIVDSILTDDEQLRAALNPHPEPLRVLYIYESKMGLLARVAASVAGADLLINCGITSRLADCTVFSMRPESHRLTEQDVGGFVPPVMSRYRQILFPALKLCSALLTSLGIENTMASSQVLRFVLGHVEVFSAILRERDTSLALDGLNELALTTAVIGRAAVDDADADVEIGDMARVEYGRQLSRLQQLIISLLPRFTLSNKLLKQIATMEPVMVADTAAFRARVLTTVEQIASNIIAFCRSMISKAGTGIQSTKIMFGASLLEATGRDGRLDDMSTMGLVATQTPSLGMIVYMLRQSTAHFLTVIEEHKQSLRKLESVTALTSEELKELCGPDVTEKLSSQDRHQRARHRLVAIIQEKAQQLGLLSYMIENCVFILWRHLEFYLLHCVPTDQGTTLFQLQQNKHRQLRRLQDPMGAGPLDAMDDSRGDIGLVTSQITRDELDQLKTDAVNCLSDSLFKKLNEIEQIYTKNRSRYNFLGALVRRLQRLLMLHTS